jgi:transcriptional regulator with XRE-family HTH domain
MRATRQLRLQYGFTQQQLADYLGVTKGLLSMVESGKRTLPTAALLKLGSMLQTPAGNDTGITGKKNTERLERQQAGAAKALEAHARNCAVDAALANKKLTGLKKNYDQAVNTLELVSKLRRVQAGNDTAAKKDILWQNMVEAIALKRLDACGEGAQQLLRIKIEALQKQAVKAKNAAQKILQKD